MDQTPRRSVPEEHRDQIIDATLDGFVHSPVPTVKRHRSEYLHALMVLVEETYNTESQSFRTFHDSWADVADNLLRYSMAERKHMPAEHRKLLWVIWTRIHQLVHSRSYRHLHEHQLLQQLQLRANDQPFRNYSVATLWRALMMLSDAWGAMPFDESIREYVFALAAQCGTFHWIAQDNKRVFDHPLFVQRVTERGDVDVNEDDSPTMLCVNEEFTVETERMFFAIFTDLKQQEWLMADVDEVTRQEPLDEAQKVAMVEWMRRSIENPSVREFIDKDFTKAALAMRIHPGEMERFAARDRFTDATAYNVLAKNRPAILDKTTDRFKNAESLARVLMYLKGPDADDVAPDRSARDVLYDATDANLLGFFCATYALDNAFAADEARFRVHFVADKLPIPWAMRDRPVIVQAMCRFHVRCGNHLWICEDICSTIWCWLTAFCDTPQYVEDAKYVAPNSAAFFETYRIVSGGRRCIAEEEAMEQQARTATEASEHLGLPNHYANAKKRKARRRRR